LNNWLPWKQSAFLSNGAIRQIFLLLNWEGQKLSNYPQRVSEALYRLKVTQKLSSDEFLLVDKYARYMAMLDCPTPKWWITKEILNRLNLVEAWYRWEHAGRRATAMMELPEYLYEIADNTANEAMFGND
jgi:hypothetical protein